MKKRAIPILLLLHLLYPVCLLTGLVWGREFSLSGEWMYLLLLTAVTILLTRAAESGRWAMPLFPVTVIDGLCAILCTRCLPAAVCAAVWCVCGGILFHRFVKKGVGKVLMLIPTAALIVILTVSCPIDLFVESMRSITVVREVDSPDGHFTAKIIDADYGATGGDTLVRIHDNRRTVNLLFGCFSPSDELGYRGQWGDWDTLDVLWSDNHILTIDGESRIICSGSAVRSIWLGESPEIAVNGTPQADPQPFLAALSRSRATRRVSVQDRPHEAVLWEIDLGTTPLFLYEENGILFIEQPYQGIWEADESLRELLS